MSTMLPGNPVSKFGYIVRALIAVVLILTFALWMVSRSAGSLTSKPVVHASVPAQAGLITSGSPVRYHGVKIGEIGGIDAGATSSRVDLDIDEGAIGTIPSNVMMRVLPRTFFGDIYVQLLPDPTRPEAAGSLSDGDEIRVDNGPDAINLYDIFTKLSDLLAEVQPDKMNIALAAVSRALGDNGDELGVMIDDWWQASHELEGSLNRFIDATPRFRQVMESLKRATPDIVKTLGSVTSISRGIVEHRDGLAEFFASASGFLGVAGPFVARQRHNLITVLDSTSTIFGTVADNSAGVSRTLSEADKFGAAGTVLFSSGRFNITAVPTFSQPMPYTAADCPTYGSMRGSQCFGSGTGLGTGRVRKPGQGNGTILRPEAEPASADLSPAGAAGPPVIDGSAERGALAGLEAVVRGGDPRAAAKGTPNPATVMMLGPMVRGTEVKVS
ncbi:MCE family protein [Gordonia sp. CPCC 206044]|uniref:MCE family protein n=1 Tax=Gordonia sp. CPCC 206044 TaxID=3140793 RepID=UPI003AF3ACAF